MNIYVDCRRQYYLKILFTFAWMSNSTMNEATCGDLIALRAGMHDIYQTDTYRTDVRNFLRHTD